MAQYTPNLNLAKPDPTDAFEFFKESYNDNMDKIDQGGGGGASALEDLTDVNITSPTDGQVLKYDAVNDEWVNGEGGGTGDVADVEVNGTSVVDPVTKVAEITSYKEVTESEYEATPVAERESNGIAYFIKDLDNSNVQGYPPLIYSDEEREVGVWRDGKPLYQKTYTTSYTANGTYSIDISSLSVDMICNSFGEYLRSNGEWTAFNHYSSGSYYGEIRTSTTQVRMFLQLPESNPHGKQTFTLQYTKTTDTAGSGIWNGQGGIAHHYSTNETVVGTWIDGSTLYEKSFDFGAIGANSNKTIDVTALNIAYVTGFECTALLNNGTIVPIPVSHTVNMSSQHFCRYNTSGTLGIYTGSGQAITQAYMTIQYTKTS